MTVIFVALFEHHSYLTNFSTSGLFAVSVEVERLEIIAK